MWWKAFGSPDLDALVERALAHNRTLAEAQAAVTEAREHALAQAGTRAPQVGGNAAAGRQQYGEQFLGPLAGIAPFSYWAVGASISYALDYTGGVARSVEQRNALADVSQQQLEAARLAVAGNVVVGALNLATLHAEIATVDAILDQDRENLKLVREAFAAGSVSRLDVVSAESQLASDATQLPTLHQRESEARNALAILVGEAPANVTVPTFTLATLTLPQDLPLTLPSELAHRRPDILAAEAQLHASTAALGVATSNLYPKIVLTATAGQQASELSHIFDRASNAWSWGAALAGPIFDGGTLRAEQRAANAALDASRAHYEQTVLTAFGQVADTLDALGHDGDLLAAQAHAQDAARDNLDLTRRSYNEGQVGVLQVLDAQRSYQQARLGYVRAEGQRFHDTARLYLALGGAGPQAPLPAIKAALLN